MTEVHPTQSDLDVGNDKVATDHDRATAISTPASPTTAAATTVSPHTVPPTAAQTNAPSAPSPSTGTGTFT
jgi:hypothetical protein